MPVITDGQQRQCLQIRHILCHVVSYSYWAFFSYDYEPSSLTTIFSYDYESYSPKALINIVVG